VPWLSLRIDPLQPIASPCLPTVFERENRPHRCAIPGYLFAGRRAPKRPHEALDRQCPAEVYQPSTHALSGLQDIDYPLHDKTVVVTRCGRICLGKKKINLSTVFAGQAVGSKEVHDDIWLVSFMNYDLGYLEIRMLEPLANLFGPKVLPM
jgi:putative transposase